MSDKKISQLTAATTPLAGTEVLPLVQSGATVKVPVTSMFGANVYTFLNTPTSANLATAVTDETGTGALVFATNPTFINAGSGNPSATFTNTAFQDTRVDYYMANNGNKITLQFASDNGVTLTNDITSYGSAAGGVPSLNNVIEMGNASGKVRVTTDGNVFATTGNFVIGTAGKGIDFSADGQAAGMTSELLDDYEEGTWTPTVDQLSVGNGVVVGRYTKIGRIVTASIDVTFGSTTSWSGTSTNITGLPFTSAQRSSGFINMFRSGTGWFAGQAIFPSGGTLLLFPGRADGAAFNATSPWAWGTDDYFNVSLTYEV